MKNIIASLWEYRFIFIAMFVIVFYAIFEWQNFKIKAYTLMLQAKSLAKDAILKSGDEQAEWVVKKAYLILPKKWRIFLSEERMRSIIYYLYHKAKDYLDDGKINGSIEA